MEEVLNNQNLTKRLCIICKKPMEDNGHGNKKAHTECAYKFKKLRQKEKYRVGNTAKLLIQKNEAIAAYLYMIDKERHGIHYVVAMEYGLKFNCPTITLRYLNKEIHMFEHYGYCIETVNGKNLIFIHYEPDFK